MTSTWWDLMHWSLTTLALTVVLAMLVAALLAIRKVGGAGAILLLVGSLAEFVGWGLDVAVDRSTALDNQIWWNFFVLGWWSLGSLTVTAGVLLLILRAGRMKERLMLLEAVVGQRGEAAPGDAGSGGRPSSGS
ncbi:MAG: hypothetical protein HKN82_07140 [Akkermansiaceae bacterium]|nr:hypothetical protein [Akkermansiaceae bacterium]